MLKGKLIMADSLVGEVLNDPERDEPIVLHLLRERIDRNNDIIMQMAGWSLTSSRWEARDKEVHFTREQLGPFEVLNEMPDWLLPENLNRDSGTPMITVIDGKSYIDW